MKKILFGLLLAGVIACGFAGTANAASTDSTLVKIPFPFVVGEKLLPAGSYRITPSGSDASTLLIESADGGALGAFAITVKVPNEDVAARDAQVLFKSHAGQRFLWRVANPGSEAREIVLRTPHMDRVLARLNLLPAEPVLGSSPK